LDIDDAEITPSTYTPSGFDSRYFVGLESIKQRLKTKQSSSTLLVDSRTHEQYAGKSRVSLAPLAGTLPNALNISFQRFFEAGSGKLDIQKAMDIVSQQKLGDKQDIVVFCNTGHLASSNWFALSEIAQKPVKLYSGSMIEWTNAKEILPIEGPGRLGQLWVDTKIWYKNLQASIQ